MGPGVGVGPLTPHRQATAVSDSPVAADIHETLDVHGYFGAQGPLNLEVAFDRTTEAVHIVVREVLSSAIGINAACRQDLFGSCVTDAVDVCQCDLDPLTAREIDASNTCHFLTLPLLVLRIATADDANYAFAANHLTVLADRLYAASDLHFCCLRIRLWQSFIV